MSTLPPPPEPDADPTAWKAHADRAARSAALAGELFFATDPAARRLHLPHGKQLWDAAYDAEAAARAVLWVETIWLSLDQRTGRRDLFARHLNMPPDHVPGCLTATARYHAETAAHLAALFLGLLPEVHTALRGNQPERDRRVAQLLDGYRHAVAARRAGGQALRHPGSASVGKVLEVLMDDEFVVHP